MRKENVSVPAIKAPEAEPSFREKPVNIEIEHQSARDDDSPLPIKPSDVKAKVDPVTEPKTLEFADDNDEISYKVLCFTRKTTKKELREKMERDQSHLF